jgi:ABC-type nickel/cobalt efflux system permease component RcnA
MTTLTWLYLPVAFVLGMAHALEPGHGKTLVASYLIGIKGTARDAVLLGLTVTFTHTVIIFVLALAVIAFGAAFPMEQVQHWLEIVSAALVFVMGLWLLRSRLREWKHEREHARLHSLSLEHDHHHHGHSHELPTAQRLTVKQLVSFGFSGGIVPCPAALAILILAVGMGKPVFGLATVAAFSIGLALALVGIGVAVCSGVALVGKRFRESKWTNRLPVLSSVAVTVLGFCVFARALLGQGHSPAPRRQ